MIHDFAWPEYLATIFDDDETIDLFTLLSIEPISRLSTAGCISWLPLTEFVLGCRNDIQVGSYPDLLLVGHISLFQAFTHTEV